MTRRFTTLLLIAVLFVLTGGGHAQEASTSRDKRAVYVVQHGDAKELAGILSKHFKGDADIQALADSPSNCLLIRSNPAVLAEIVKLLDQLDRRPRLVSIELLIAEVKSKKGKDGKPDGKELDPKEFTGSRQEVGAKLDALRKAGLLDGLKRIQLTAATDQPASVLLGETKPIVTGITTTGTGLVSKSITYRNTGTNVKVTVRVAAENTITLELDVSDSRVRVPDDGVELGKDEAGGTIRAAEVILATLKTRLTVGPDQAVAAHGVKTESKSGGTQTLIFVSGRILEPAAKGSK